MIEQLEEIFLDKDYQVAPNISLDHDVTKIISKLGPF